MSAAAFASVLAAPLVGAVAPSQLGSPPSPRAAHVMGGLRLRGGPPLRLAACAARPPATRRAAAIVAMAGKGKALSDPETSKFLSWAQGAGIQYKDISLADFGGLRGVMANAPIGSETRLVTVPDEYALQITPAMSSPLGDMVDRSSWSKSKWWVKMGLYIVWHKKQGASSKLAPWIESLPKDFGTPVSWSDDAIKQLQYPYLEQQVKEQQREWAAVYDDLIQENPGCGITREELYWGMGACRSRTFSGPFAGATFKERIQLVGILGACVAAYTLSGAGELTQALNGAVAAIVFNVLYDALLSNKRRWYAVCPVIDMINHRSGSGSEVSYAYFQDEFEVTMGSSVAAGEEVFITYGDRGNDELLQYYGFVEEGASSDSYVVTEILDKIKARGVAVNDTNVAALKEAGPVAMKDIDAARLTASGFNLATLRALRFVTAADDLGLNDLENCDGPLSARGEAELYAALAGVCAGELEGKPSVSQDLASLKNTGMVGEEKALAIRFRAQKKKLVSACGDLLQAQAEALAAAV